MNYSPIRQRYTSPSDVTNQLLKRKRILEKFGGKADEWLMLAEDFLADDGRLNHAYCMNQYKRLGGEIDAPVQFDYVPEEPDWMERKDLQ